MLNPEKKDFSNAVKEDERKLVRLTLIVIGNISFVLGVIGIFLPLLPTTPFLLLAAACFAKSSKRFYNRLLNSPVFGKYIQDWMVSRRVPNRTKAFAITLIVLTMGSSIYFFVPYLWAKIGGVIVAVGVIVYILRLPGR